MNKNIYLVSKLRKLQAVSIPMLTSLALATILGHVDGLLSLFAGRMVHHQEEVVFQDHLRRHQFPDKSD